MRFFNTAGPVRCDDHYCLPPLERFDLDEIISLINQKKYFVLHAPRQTGKTSCLLALMEHLNAIGQFKTLYFNVESAQGAREDVFRGIRAILSEMADRAEAHLEDESLQDIWIDVLQRSGEDAGLNAAITRWCKSSSTPVVLLIDEIDSLVGDTLISVLRQLRAGYDKRPALFPQSLMLCGVRDVRDYQIHSAREKAIITGGSAFNIKAESLRLGDFNRDEMGVLLKQHTEETGQGFEPKALNLVWHLTEGQPWLVNAMAYEACFKMKEGRDRTRQITVQIIEEAKENLILRRDTHIDQLADKLRENRVRRVIQPILTGREQPELLAEDDLQYVADLGLIKTEGQLRISNKIYKEVIPRALTYTTQLTISQESAWYVKDDGFLDIDKLLFAFQDFFRKHSEHWVERFDYKEAGPQLLLQAFLQRIVNNDGRVEREYGLGRMRTDLLVIWSVGAHRAERKAQSAKDVQKVVIELKILHGSPEQTVEDGLKQTWAYMDKCGTDEGHLIIFDRGEGKSWDEKIFYREEVFHGKTIKVWGM